MKRETELRPAAWRGSSHLEGAHAEDRDSTPGAGGRVLIAMGHSGNRQQIIDHLGGYFPLVDPRADGAGPGSFDLAIVDAAGLKDWWTLVLDAKFAAEPTFLPVVLILSRSGLKQRLRPYWDIIDEFVTTPIYPSEFTERISMLLRTRRLALTQRNRLTHVVNHDRVTGLPNENLFMARLADSLRDASILGTQAHVSVLHMPLSRVLSSFGHRGLDVVATRVSSRLTSLVGDDASLARLTTEEWGLIHGPGVKLHNVLAALGRVRSLGDAPFEVSGESIHLSPRIGVGVYPLDGADAPTLVDRAMSALATAKNSEPVFYAPEVQLKALRSIRTEARLHDALANDEFELWFQPQVNTSTGALLGVEALVRWRLPSGELVPPGQFLPVAAETGQICAIDRWVLENACRTMQRWREEALPIGHMSVNVSNQDLVNDDFVDAVRSALTRTNLPAHCLTLELTETDMIEAGEANIAKLATLLDEGVRIAVDDFGTGYSSLAYLRRLPLSSLKIDRTFVNEMLESNKVSAITEAIVWLGQRLGLQIVAEGIETPAQASFLARLGVTTVQGFMYGRPMPEAALRAWLHEKEARPQPAC